MTGLNLMLLFSILKNRGAGVFVNEISSAVVEFIERLGN
jgi:hypothetical protein